MNNKMTEKIVYPNFFLSLRYDKFYSNIFLRYIRRSVSGSPTIVYTLILLCQAVVSMSSAERNCQYPGAGAWTKATRCIPRIFTDIPVFRKTALPKSPEA